MALVMTDHNPFPPVICRNGWEERLRENAKLGRVCSLGKRRPALDPGGEGFVGPVVRSEMIQRLAMGGDKDAPVHSRGVDLRNALIDGDLDFTHCSLKRNIRLINCVVTGYINLIGASGETIDLSGSRVLGSDPDGDAIAADRLKLSGSLFFRASGGEDAEPFEVDGAIRLYLADIRGNLNFAGGRFGCSTMEDVSGHEAVIARGARIGGQIRISNSTRLYGRLNLAAARSGSLSLDTIAAKKNKNYLRIDGFTFERIEGEAKLFDYEVSKKYLNAQPSSHRKTNFRTQPHEQLARVISNMGNTYVSDQILLRKQYYIGLKKLRDFLSDISSFFLALFCLLGIWIEKKKRKRWRRKKLIDLRRYGFRVLTKWVGVLVHFIFGAMVGFGFRPVWAFWWLAAFVIAGSFVFAAAYEDGVIVPNDPFVLRSDDWMWCLREEEAGASGSAAECWLTQKQPDPENWEGLGRDGDSKFPIRGYDFPAFRPLVFAFDSFVPFLDLQQEKRWVPDADRGSIVEHSLVGSAPFGWWTLAYLYLHIGVGWVVTALFAASFTRLIKSG